MHSTTSSTGASITARQSTRSREDAGRGEGSGVASALAANAARSSLILCVLFFFWGLGATAKTSVVPPFASAGCRSNGRGPAGDGEGDASAFVGAAGCAGVKSRDAGDDADARTLGKSGGAATQVGGFVAGSVGATRTGIGGTHGGAGGGGAAAAALVR